MNTVGAIWGSMVTYATVFGSALLANQQGIISFLGLVLLVARLVHDIPKAYNVIKTMFPKKNG